MGRRNYGEKGERDVDLERRPDRSALQDDALTPEQLAVMLGVCPACFEPLDKHEDDCPRSGRKGSR